MVRLLSVASAVILMLPVLSGCLSDQRGDQVSPTEIEVELYETVLGPVRVTLEAADGSIASRRLSREVQSIVLRNRRGGEELEGRESPIRVVLEAELRTRDSKNGGMLSRDYLLTLRGELRGSGDRALGVLTGRIERSSSRFILQAVDSDEEDNLLDAWDDRFYRRAAGIVYEKLDSIYKK